MTDQEISLAGQLLIAMPGMGDPRFDHSVILLCAHSDEGAMGVIVNKVLPDLSLGELLGQLGIDETAATRPLRVHLGGPVEKGRGFILHSDDYSSDNGSLPVPGGMMLTATTDVLQELAKGAGPSEAILTLGYAGWGPGQLESELAGNVWLTAPARPDILWSRADDHKWSAAIKQLGIDPALLSGTGGRA